MHSSRFACLMILGFLAPTAIAQEVQPPKDPNAPLRKEVRRTPAPRAKSEPNKSKQTWSVRGFGANHEDAYEQAVRQAHLAVSGFLFDRGINWEPSVEEVRQMIVSKKDEKLTEDDELTAITANNKVVLLVECSDAEYRKFLKKDRLARADRRVFGIGKWLAVVLVGLTFLGGYLRLEEATKGYYTLWLRLGMLGMIGAAAAGLFIAW